MGSNLGTLGSLNFKPLLVHMAKRRRNGFRVVQPRFKRRRKVFLKNRFPVRFRRTGKRSPFAKAVGRVIKAQAEQKVKTLVGQVFTPTSAVPAVFSVIRVAQGTEADERIGDRISVRKMTFRGTIRRDALNVFVVNIVRILFVQTTDRDGAQVTPSEIFQTPTDVHSLYLVKKDRTRKFIVLTDKMYKLVGALVPPIVGTSARIAYEGTSAAHEVQWKHTMVPKMHHIFFDGVGEADYRMNNISMVMMTDELLLTPTVNFMQRTWWTDV